MKGFKLFVLGVISLAPTLSNSAEVTLHGPQAVAGLDVYLQVEPSASARDWAAYHKPAGAETSELAVRTDRDRHLVVVVVDKATGQRVVNAVLQLTTLYGPQRHAAASRYLDRMVSASGTSYGTVMTVKPSVKFDVLIDIALPDRPGTQQVRFTDVEA